MSLRVSSLVAALFVGAAQAQQAADANDPARRELVALQALAGETVWQVQPTVVAPGDGAAPAPQGTVVHRPFARVCDAHLTPAGHLVAFVVDAPDGAANAEGDADRRFLLATAVDWDVASRRWIATNPDLRFQELTAVPPRTARSTVAVVYGEPVLASRLAAAQWTGLPLAKAVNSTDAARTKTASPTALLWFSPVAKALAFAVVQHGERTTPLPWAVLRVEPHGDDLRIAVTADPEQVMAGPTATEPAAQPTLALRQRCYEHYQVKPPQWDQARSPARQPDRPDGQERMEARER
jgi:hypothetical protein